MKLTLFGATGRTGKHLLEGALAAGHEVTAYVRSPDKLTPRPGLTVLAGGLHEADKIARAVAGRDAVLVALGPARGGAKDVMETAARNITLAMEKTGVRRLVTLTGAGVAQPGDTPRAFNRVMSFLLKRFAGDVLEDSSNHAAVVRQSPLDWTIVRVPMLTDGSRKPYRVGRVGSNDGPRIGRADVADFMLKQLADTTHLRQAPVVSY